MQIKKVFVCPHGDQMLQPQKVEAYEPENQILHDSMKAIAQEFQEVSPNLVFYITPHNAALYEDNCIFLNEQAFGRVEPPSDTLEFDQFKSSVKIDSILAEKMVKNLRNQGLKVEGLTSYGETHPITLAWAEVIPLWFIQKYNSHKDFNVIFLSVANRRKTVANEMVGEMVELGNQVYKFIEQNVPQDQKVVVINSCDLAHTFEITYGPEKGQEPYGISPTAQPFDNFVQKWAEIPTKEEGLVSLYQGASSIVMEALSCGFCGLCLVSGIMNTFVELKMCDPACDLCIIKTSQNYSNQEKNLDKKTIESTVYCNLHPTYFGQMVASFNLLA